MITKRTPQSPQPIWFVDSLAACPVMGVFRGHLPEATVNLAEAAWDAGVINVEIPIETPAAVASLSATVSAGAARGLRVGAGTIVSVEQMQSAINVGAAYGVSPGLDLELIAEAAKRGFPFIPGVATASELLAAHNRDFRWVKAFPASELGPGWFAAIKGPFPAINLVATGGVTGHSAATFLSSGASVVGIGGGFGRSEELAALRSLINNHSAEISREPPLRSATGRESTT